MTKEKPIIFSGQMVKAILEGQKTQTRRIVKQTPIAAGPDWSLWYDEKIDAQLNQKQFAKLRCPFGSPGTLLWVRETWQPLRMQTTTEMAKELEIVKRFQNGEIKDILAGADELSSVGRTGDVKAMYAADFGDWAYNVDSDLKPWKSPIFMPRHFSRITLEVTEVRVERLQEISDSDCEAEGVRPSVDGDAKDWFPDETGWRRTYRQLWESLHGKGSWDANPWVFVITFRKV